LRQNRIAVLSLYLFAPSRGIRLQLFLRIKPRHILPEHARACARRDYERESEIPLHSGLLSLKIIDRRLCLIWRRATLREPVTKILELAPVFGPKRLHQRDLGPNHSAFHLWPLGCVRAIQCAVQNDYVLLSFVSHARPILISFRSGNRTYVAEAGCGDSTSACTLRVCCGRGTLSVWSRSRNVHLHWLGKRIRNQSGAKNGEEHSRSNLAQLD